MITSCVRAFAIAFLALPAVALAQQSAPTSQSPSQTPVKTPTKTTLLSEQLVRAFQSIQGDLAATAEKMPAEHYSFRPVPEIKPFGQLVAHVALAQFRDCAMLKGEPNPKKDDKEDITWSKADAVSLLKASSDYCAAPVSALNTEPMMTELIKFEQMQVAKGLIPTQLIVHAMEMYGTMSVYLRLKGLVPPMTEKQNQMKKSQ